MSYALEASQKPPWWLIILTAIVLILLLSDCASYNVGGVVIGKKYSPATLEQERVMVTIDGGQSYYVNDRLRLNGEDHILILKSGEEVYVMPNLWRSVNVGDTVRKEDRLFRKDFNNRILDR